MTKITIFRNRDNEFLGFECLGHAGYAEEGEDIVCAGISALVINTVNSLGLYTKDAFSTDSDEETRSEERRVGKECRSRWSPYH